MDIRHLLKQSITVAPYVSANAFGEAGYGAQRQVAARYEVAVSTQPGTPGARAVLTGPLVVAEAVGPQDRIWLAEDNSADATQARVPGPGGVKAGPRLVTGAVAFYEVEL